jgi:flagellar biosynthesis/type III secretory pathway protein FliH
MHGFLARSPLVIALRPDVLDIDFSAARIPAEAVSLVLDAEAARDESLAQAQRLIDAAQQVQDDSRQEGLEEGRALAREEVLEVTHLLQQQLRRWIEETAPQITKLVTRCVREVIRGFDSEVLVAESVDRGIRELATATELRVRIAPDDLEVVRPMIERLTKEHDVRGSIRLESDQSLRAGDCVVESPMGVLDLRIDTQLKLIELAVDPE